MNIGPTLAFKDEHRGWPLASMRLPESDVGKLGGSSSDRSADVAFVAELKRETHVKSNNPAELQTVAPMRESLCGRHSSRGLYWHNHRRVPLNALRVERSRLSPGSGGYFCLRIAGSHRFAVFAFWEG